MADTQLLRKRVEEGSPEENAPPVYNLVWSGGPPWACCTDLVRTMVNNWTFLFPMTPCAECGRVLDIISITKDSEVLITVVVT